MNLDDFKLVSEETIYEALIKIDNNKKGFLLVIDENNRLVGTLTDGDIRRGLLKRVSLDDNIETIMFTKFSFIHDGKYTFQEIENIRNDFFSSVGMFWLYESELTLCWFFFCQIVFYNFNDIFF